MRRRTAAVLAGIAAIVVGAGPALACGGLVAPNGTINLLRTTTLAAYHDGVEHYVTSFEFAGGGGRFGSIVPLPGVPSDVRRGGDWTLQRLVEEVQPPVLRSALAADGDFLENSAKVLLETRIEALDITILEGGGDEVGRWAEDNGFALPPDAPEVLDFYAARSPIFMAAQFDAKEAKERGQQVGDGTPIHLTIPTPDPWVPLRILGLGRQPNETISADVFLLTDTEPLMLPVPTSAGTEGFVLAHSEAASDDLMFDLRSDKGMKWMPRQGMWLSHIKIDERARDLTHDLAVDVSGAVPSPVAAGLIAPAAAGTLSTGAGGPWAWLLAAGVGVVVLAAANRVAVRVR